MRIFLKKAWSFIGDEAGASAIEYVLLITLIAMAITLAATALGGNLSQMYQNSSSRLSAAS